MDFNSFRRKKDTFRHFWMKNQVFRDKIINVDDFNPSRHFPIKTKVFINSKNILEIIYES